MKLPITKIKKLLRDDGDSFTHVEVSLWPKKGTDEATPNMLLSDCEDICDIGTLAMNDVYECEDDAGLIKLDLRLSDYQYYNTGYREVLVFDGEPYIELPSHLSTELARAIYMANKGKK